MLILSRRLLRNPENGQDDSSWQYVSSAAILKRSVILIALCTRSEPRLARHAVAMSNNA